MIGIYVYTLYWFIAGYLTARSRYYWKANG